MGVIEGLRAIAASLDMSVDEFGPAITTIVHGTTVTTNAVLTRGGARTGLLTTEGVRDALEMRRGIREDRYDNRLQNVPPLVPRRLRVTVARPPRSQRRRGHAARSRRRARGRARLSQRGNRGGGDLFHERVRRPVARARGAGRAPGANSPTPTSARRPTCCRSCAFTTGSPRPCSMRTWVRSCATT